MLSGYCNNIFVAISYHFKNFVVIYFIIYEINLWIFLCTNTNMKIFHTSNLIFQDALLVTITSFIVIHPNEEEFMMSKLNEGICLCATIWVSKEFLKSRINSTNVIVDLGGIQKMTWYTYSNAHKRWDYTRHWRKVLAF